MTVQRESPLYNKIKIVLNVLIILSITVTFVGILTSSWGIGIGNILAALFITCRLIMGITRKETRYILLLVIILFLLSGIYFVMVALHGG